MSHQILLIIVLVLMVGLFISNIVTNHKNYKEIKEIKESLEAGNTLRDKVITTLSNNEEKREEDFKEHIEILSLIRKNTNKKDSPQKKDSFKKPNFDKKPTQQYNNQKA